MAVPQTAYNPAQWSSFLSAEIGASAALVGLLFVAISINLAKIVGDARLVARAAKALSTFLGVLFVTTLCLAPGQSAHTLGCELLLVGALAWCATGSLHLSAARKNPFVTRGQVLLQGLLAHAAGLPPVLCGLSLLLGRGGGLYWLVAAVLLGFTSALLDAWVLLVEIQR